ncbi:Os02g0504050, partial [Oryza sativa Japonica Group]
IHYCLAFSGMVTALVIRENRMQTDSERHLLEHMIYTSSQFCTKLSKL